MDMVYPPPGLKPRNAAMPNTQAQSKVLGSELELGNVLFVLFIPSKDKHGKDLKDAELWISAAGDKLTELFGGATEMPPAKGKWYNEETGKIIAESVVLIHSYATEARANDEKRIKVLAEFLHRMGRDTNQGEVAVVIDGVFHRIRKFKPGGAKK